MGNANPFIVAVENSVVDRVTLSDGFMNEGGNLAIRDMTVTDSTIGALVSAESGTVIIDGLDVSGGSVGVR